MNPQSILCVCDMYVELLRQFSCHSGADDITAGADSSLLAPPPDPDMVESQFHGARLAFML